MLRADFGSIWMAVSRPLMALSSEVLLSPNVTSPDERIDELRFKAQGGLVILERRRGVSLQGVWRLRGWQTRRRSPGSRRRASSKCWMALAKFPFSSQTLPQARQTIASVEFNCMAWSQSLRALSGSRLEQATQARPRYA